MISFSVQTLSCLAILLALPLSAFGSPNIIADSRIRRPDISPALGRGFSASTYDVLSTCLDFSKTTEPTYNYDYSRNEVDTTGSISESMAASMKGSVSAWWVKAQLSAQYKSSKEKNTKSYNIVTKMSVERYYSSVDDSSATLSSDALSLLDKNDVIGFFQGCGGGYIRSIRRVAEVVAIFKLESSDEKSVKELAASIKIDVRSPFYKADFAGSFERKAASQSSRTSTTIEIRAFGLGLREDGSDTLVATSLEDYNNAMKYAFKSMQNPEVGVIHGIEVVNWVNNLQFQNAVQFDSIPRRDWNEVLGEFEDGPIMTGVEVKAITAANADFITMMESSYQSQLKSLLKLRQCFTDLTFMNMREDWKHRILVDHTKFTISPTSETDDSSAATVAELYDFFATKDPAGNDVVGQLSESLAVFIRGFYGPCAEKLLQSSNNGRMTQHYFSSDMKDFCKIECFLSNKMFKGSDGKYDCEDASFQNSNSFGFSIDNIISRYCFPELDDSEETRPPPGGNVAKKAAISGQAPGNGNVKPNPAGNARPNPGSAARPNNFQSNKAAGAQHNQGVNAAAGLTNKAKDTLAPLVENPVRGRLRRSA